MLELTQATHVWLVDFEFHQPDGFLPTPICIVAREWGTGRTVRSWLAPGTPSPFQFGPDDVLVAYYASAEIGCFLALGWDLPRHILDLYPEFRWVLSGRSSVAGFGLLGALTYFGISNGVSAAKKDEMRAVAQGNSFSAEEQQALLDYCESDVVALDKLLKAMLPEIDLPRALLRGRYMAAAARIERTGIPIDTDVLDVIKDRWTDIRHALIADVDAEFGVYEGSTFVAARWLHWCANHGVLWPLTPMGRPQLDDDTFGEMAKVYPAILPVKELRASLGQLRLCTLSVGPDGRNRYLLSAFGSKTSRNQPSNAKAIFGPATWFRCLIKPEPGRALAYLDYEQQEFGIGAVLSGDANMKEAYASGDPYLRFAIQAGAVPATATKQSHPREREQYKTCALGVQYGIGEAALGQRLNIAPAYARVLIEMHKKVYAQYWRWSNSVETRAMLGCPLVTAFGWRILAGSQANPRSLRNFPLQANGAEMLRIASIALTEAGIRVCAPVHDAVLIEADESRIEPTVAEAQRMMERASQAVLGNFTLRTEAKIIRFPDRYSDPRGEAMWQRVMRLVSPYLPAEEPLVAAA